MKNEDEETVEDPHLEKVYQESKNEPKRSFDELIEEMRRNGEIDI